MYLFVGARMAFEGPLTSLEDDRTVRAAKAIGEALSKLHAGRRPRGNHEAPADCGPSTVGKHTITMAGSYHKVVDGSPRGTLGASR